jgi:TRAP-type transport system small permease protein
MRSALGRLADWMAAAALRAAALLLGAMALVIIFVVAQRYVFGRTPYWSEELPRLLLIWSAFLGAVAAARGHGHLSAGLLPLLLPNGAATRAIGYFRGLLVLAVCCVMAKASFDLTVLTAGHLTPALQISAGWSYAAAILGFGGLAVLAFENLLADPGK